MVARIYNKELVSLSSYIDFGNKSLPEIKACFHSIFYGHLKGVRYIYSLTDDKYYNWRNLKECKSV